MDKIDKIKEIQKRNGWLNKIENDINKHSSLDNDDQKNEFIKLSIENLTNRIQHKVSPKLSAKDLQFINLDEESRMTIQKWIDKNDFRSIRFEIENETIKYGNYFCGFQKVGDEVFPFTAKINNLIVDPITKKILSLRYEIGTISIGKREVKVTESYEWKNGTYQIQRQADTLLPKSYRRNESSQIILGEVFFNNPKHKSDIEPLLLWMKNHGEFLFYHLEKFLYLSAKVLEKSAVSGKNAEEINKEFRTKTMINFNSRASQFQQPITVFNPTLPNQTIETSIDYLEAKIFEFAITNTKSGDDKKAQTNDLETSTKNEDANNYLEYKQYLRQLQLSNYFTKLLFFMELIKEDEKVEVRFELATQQKRVNEGDN